MTQIPDAFASGCAQSEPRGLGGVIVGREAFQKAPAHLARGDLCLDLVDPARVGRPGHQLLARRRRDEGVDRIGTDNGWGGRCTSRFVGGGLP